MFDVIQNRLAKSNIPFTATKGAIRAQGDCLFDSLAFSLHGDGLSSAQWHQQRHTLSANVRHDIVQWMGNHQATELPSLNNIVVSQGFDEKRHSSFEGYT